MGAESWTQDLLAWVNANPAWGALIVFGVAFFESLVLVGIILPGVMILFGMGTLIGLGVIDLVSVWLAASLGALLGDSLSYLLGFRNREHLLEVWPFSRYPGMMDRGIRFFRVHGSKGVVAGRFIGPLRPVVPAVAGIMGMRPTKFFTVDVAACIAWAPSFLLPGILFGASLEVASEYTGRLTMVLVVGLGALWLTWWLMRLIYEPLASRSARWMRHAIRWTRRHPVLGRVSGPLLDPAQPEVLSVSMLGALLVVIFWGLGMLMLMEPFSAQPKALDQGVQALALSLHNHLADPALVAISQLSKWPVMLFSSAAVLFWLIGARRHVAALHWLAAIGGGWLLQLLLDWSLRSTPPIIEMSGEWVRVPSSPMVLITVVFSFFAVMVAREVRRKHRQWPYLVAALVLTLQVLARLYLGLEWFSGVLMGLLLGLAWTLIVGIAYRQRAMRPFSGAVAGLIFYGSLFGLFVWQANEHTAEEVAALQTPPPLQVVSADEWWVSGWRELPVYRTGAFTRTTRRFNAQVAGAADQLEERLARQGWARVPDTDWRWILQALNPRPDEASLPLLGRAFEGRSETLLLRRHDHRTGELQTVRLWDSGYRLRPGDAAIYLAQISNEHLVQRFGFFSYWRSVPLPPQRLEALLALPAELEYRQVTENLVLLRSATD
ncbi:VTT domain-containing protein [Elongatibacter sediminis]|uniref:VTT domain-containing protein n=1 Tax=Elongatibacter sediminis TaxID=3119006 RepID=A0AAW9R7Y9_9GAMM